MTGKKQTAKAVEQEVKEVIKVKIVKNGDKPREVEVPTGAKVAEALSKAQIKGDGARTQVNGKAATRATVLQDGDIISLVPQIRGGC